MLTQDLHRYVLSCLKARTHRLAVQRMANIWTGAVAYVIEKTISNHSEENLQEQIELDKSPMLSSGSADLFLTPGLDVYDFKNQTVTCITTVPPIVFKVVNEDEQLDVLQAVMNDLEPNRTFERVKTPFLR